MNTHKTSEEIKDLLLHSMSQLFMEYGIIPNAWIVSENYLQILKRDVQWIEEKYFDNIKDYKIFICGKPVIVASIPNIAMAVIVGVEEF